MKYKCDSCDVEWDYPVRNCIFCGAPLSKINNTKYQVEGATRVLIPSVDHPITPYYVLLLKDLSGSHRFHKSFRQYNNGDTIYLNSNEGRKYTIGIIGTGVTGKGLAELAIRTGNNIILKSRSEDSFERALNVISKNLSKEMEPNRMKIALNRITTTTNYEQLATSDLIIESVVEDFKIKKSIFKKLDSICEPTTILASNTSTLPISKLSNGLKHPERVIGMHFFNPIPRMMLVELIRGKNTGEETLNRATEFAEALNKIPVNVVDIAGFIVNRLLFLMINEACCMLDSGIASIEDIDKAMKLGANHPMGPFELADFIGVDICLSILGILYSELKNPSYKPAKILHIMANDGILGRKAGKGFYKYG